MGLSAVCVFRWKNQHFYEASRFLSNKTTRFTFHFSNLIYSPNLFSSLATSVSVFHAVYRLLVIKAALPLHVLDKYQTCVSVFTCCICLNKGSAGPRWGMIWRTIPSMSFLGALKAVALIITFGSILLL